MRSATADLPQASPLAKVRRLVAVVAAGKAASGAAAGAHIGLSPRHAAYYTAAATVTLRLLATTKGRLAPTVRGAALLASRVGSFEERSILAAALNESESVASIAPDLLEADGPSRQALTARLVTAGLSAATAARRASTLLSWRRYVLDRQATLAVPLARTRPEARKRRSLAG